jgi:hypothetical protein
MPDMTGQQDNWRIGGWFRQFAPEQPSIRPSLGMEERAAREGSCAAAAICRWLAHCGAGAAAGGMSGTMAVNGGT